MKVKSTLLFLLIIVSISFAYISPSFSLKLTYTADFTNNFPELVPSYYISTNFWINTSILGSNFSGTFSIGGSSLDSAELNFSKNKFGFNVYKNRVFGNTDDNLGLYKFDIGSDGIMVKYSNFYLFLYNSLNLNYLKYEGYNKKIVFGSRDNRTDFLFQISFPTFVNISLETIYTNYENLSFEKGVYQIGITDRNWNWGLKYTYVGSEVSLPEYTNINIFNKHLINLWYNFQNVSVWTNIKSDENGLNFQDLSEIGFNMNFSNFSASFSKIGFNDFGLTPEQWGKFNFTINSSFKLFGFNGKVSYSFGNPAHNTIGTLGEVYYLELSKTFGNLSIFSKFQRIVGVYEIRNTLYAELKLTGFSNGEVKLSIGNGDFYNVNTFKEIVSLEFNTWW
ncbi:hypothetical protein [Thermosipho atlanticus]|uniref:Uncharacterized protein n=1 Tax=Thermosipho atlanticus DSM 15807 TaxID=1123380 RepID=A0A1M5U1V9_9BACT|nr:hypothetical protein [Thermosipho atlanticus]SHH56841.1 hypothetical protein SAMN02745199_1591 [Thermosipho atlanticus DSM 15807]